MRQGYPQSLQLFNTVLERILTDTLADHEGNVSTGGRKTVIIRFDNDIAGISCLKTELNQFDRTMKTEIRIRVRIQLTLVISTLLISNNRLSRSENLVPS